ncbi:MAG: phosphatase PAP2 family protein [Nitrospina sp.]|jgi:membrane-associated phospholipid phosphatase|nr:phosphatase PAP2 family protein [Nitrospina sp.]
MPKISISLKVAIFFLAFLMMVGGRSYAEGLSESEFFEEDFDRERSRADDLSESEFFEESFDRKRSRADDLSESEVFVDGFEERSHFFDSDFEKFKLSDGRSYTSSPRKRKSLRDSQKQLKLNSKYFKGIFSDIAYTATSPSRWDRSDWIMAGWVAGGTGMLIALDEEIRDTFEDARSSTTDDLANIFEPFGNGAFTVPALVGFYIFGHFNENEKAKRTALIATESFLVTGLYTTVIKVAFGRHRPSTGDSSTSFDGFTTDHSSFPSGHTSTAFAIATVVANEYEKVPYIKPISYGLAALTGLSRINDEKHWASDIFFGAALGYFTSKTILRLHNNKKGQHFTIYPRVDSQGGGIVLSKKF